MIQLMLHLVLNKECDNEDTRLIHSWHFT